MKWLLVGFVGVSFLLFGVELLWGSPRTIDNIPGGEYRVVSAMNGYAILDSGWREVCVQTDRVLPIRFAISSTGPWKCGPGRRYVRALK